MTSLDLLMSIAKEKNRVISLVQLSLQGVNRIHVTMAHDHGHGEYDVHTEIVASGVTVGEACDNLVRDLICEALDLHA